MLIQNIQRYCTNVQDIVRVRFAPSPTGYLHLGGLRTALYNFAFAKSQGGKFILRIEDTDQVRLVPGSVERILDDLSWAGLAPDEGPGTGGPYGPYVQSQRRQLYRAEVDKLIESGKAYHCFCSKRRLDLLRQNAVRNQEVPKYDNHCRGIRPEEVAARLARPDGQPPCVRFKLTSSEPFTDLVYGQLLHECEDIEGDPVILKSDGWPTYHLANVVDDHAMQITHVIRGVEWIQSTNKHLMIYRALGYRPPHFAHLPLLLHSDGSKLSKRHGSFSVESFRERGVLPRALLNFITKAGSGFHVNWTQEASFSLQELVEKFELSSVNMNSCKLPTERLDDFNRAEIRRQIGSSDEISGLVEDVKALLIRQFPDKWESGSLDLSDSHIETVLRWSQQRVSYLSDFLGPNLLFLWQKPTPSDLDGVNPDLLEDLKLRINDLVFEKGAIIKSLRQMCEENSVPFKQLMTFLRSTLSGLQSGPGVAEMMEVLGKETTLKRIDSAISTIKQRNKN